MVYGKSNPLRLSSGYVYGEMQRVITKITEGRKLGYHINYDRLEVIGPSFLRNLVDDYIKRATY
jgi:hypothetical protein